MKRLPLSLLVGVVAWPALASAQEDLEGLLDQTVVTAASKSAEVSATAPGTSTVIPAQDLRRFGIHTVAEAVDFLSFGAATSGRDVTGQLGGLGARGVQVAGDEGNHFLLLVNGHSVNEPLAGSARFDRSAGIPLEMVDRIEVILGPGSVLYGSNAMLGVINVVTKRAKDFKGTRLLVESELLTSVRAMTGAGYEFDLFGEPAEITASLEYYQRFGPSFDLDRQNLGIDPISAAPTRTSPDGPATGIWGGRVDDDSFVEAPAGLLRFKRGDLQVTLQASTYRSGVPYGNADFDDPDSDHLLRQAWIDVSYQKLVTPAVELTLRGYGDTHDSALGVDVSRESACFYLNAETCRVTFLGASRWAGAELRGAFDWFEDGTAVTLVGFDGQYRYAGTKSDTEDAATGEIVTDSTGAFTVEDFVFGAYAQQTFTPNRWLGLNAGARIDHDPRFPLVVSPRAAASVVPWEGGTLKFTYAEAYRAPSYTESELTAGLRLAPLSLDPERVRSFEASVEQRVGAHHVRTALFASRWRKLVNLHSLSDAEKQRAVAEGRLSFIAPQTDYQEFRNLDGIDNYGVSLGYEGGLSMAGLSWGANLTSAIAEPDSGEELPVAPHYFGNARVAYDLPKDLPTLTVAGFWASRRLADRGADQSWAERPYAPTQLELKATISGEVPPLRGLSYRVGADYSLADRVPFVIGPTQTPTADQPTPSLAPTDRFRAFVGLEYQL
ncbi:MAG: TonB-dependent receptor [Myxococcales bacterium]|nr:TonB-dependent receptor [Myxococcales bacterium]